MAPSIRSHAIVTLAATVSACGGSPAPTPAPASAPKPAAAHAPPGPAASTPKPPTPAAAAVVVTKAAAEVLSPPAPRYDPKGRRDPFDNLEVQAQEKEKATGLTIASAKLTGIVRGHGPLALIETADGVGYILKPGDTLGDGRLLEIAKDSAVFAVAPKPGSPSNRVVLKITVD